MIKLKTLLLLTVAFCGLSYSFSASPVPSLTGRIVDQAKVLSSSERQHIERTLQQFEQETGGQMAILILSQLPEDQSIEEYSLLVAETWKLGHKGQDNGALLLLALKDRQMRLEVGDGWEGVIPDAKAGDVIRGMTPDLRKENYRAALSHAIGHVKAFVLKDPEAIQKYNPQQDRPLWVDLIGIGIVILFVFLSVRYPNFFLFVLISQLLSSTRRGGFGGGGGGFRGGGGSFSGGGASGRW